MKPIRPTRRSHEEGAAMLVVLFVLLMATATGLYAVHSTVSEIRGAGFYRQASQTQQESVVMNVKDYKEGEN